MSVNRARVGKSHRGLRVETECSVDGCPRPYYGRGFCQRHYRRWYEHGEPGDVRIGRPSPVERFWSRVDRDGPIPEVRPDLGPCWLWTGPPSDKGYGVFAVREGDRYRRVKAHRFSWQADNGPVPEDRELDHLCRVRLCVRPSHLEPVTHAENVRRAVEARACQ